MFTNLFPPVFSGSAMHSFALCRELASRGHRPFVITARLDMDTPEYEEVNSVPVYRLPAVRMPKMPIALNCPWISYTFSPGNQRRIAQIIRRHNPDVLHLHNHMFDMAFSAVRMKQRFCKPLVITFHTVIKHANPFYDMLLFPADRIFLRQAVSRFGDILICPDMNMQKYVMRSHRMAPTKMVPYGIDLLDSAAPGHVDELRMKYNLNGKRVILSLGHVHDVRHRGDEIRAMKIVRQKIPNAVLLIAGAEMSDTARKTVGLLNMAEGVIFAGTVPYSDVSALLALADIEGHLFYQYDQEETSLGNATLEAMGSGKATFVAANKDSYGRNWLLDDENLCLVQRDNPQALAERIIDLLDDDAKRQRIGRAATELVRKHFSWESVCRQTIRVYGKAHCRNISGRA
jgi:glycosyltransferase involved in cell wall biosynthesis